MTTYGKISAEEVEHIAWLAKIELTKSEKELFAKQFNIILKYFSVINELDTEIIQPTSYVTNVLNILREDEVISSLSMDEALNNASNREREFFRAPKII